MSDERRPGGGRTGETSSSGDGIAGDRRTLRKSIADPDEQLSAFRRTVADLTHEPGVTGNPDLGALTDELPAHFAYLGPDGHYRFANRRYRERFGLGAGQILGRHYTEVLPSELAERVRDKVEDALGGRRATFELDIQGRDGSSRWLQVRYVPQLDPEGKLEGVFVLATDITALKEAQAAEQESQERFRAIVEAFEGLIYICSADYRVEFMNQRFIERTGYDGTGQSCYTVIHDRDEICPWCVNREVFQGKTLRWEVKSPKDDRWYFVVNAPIRHADGKVSKQAMIVDITDRRLAEEELKASEEKYNKLFQHSRDGIILHDELGAILDANQRAGELLGYEVRELLAKRVSDLHPSAELERSREAFESVTATGSAGFEIEFLKKDGTTFPAEVSSSLFEVRGKKVIQGVVRDISRRRRLEEERVELERRIQHAQKLESLGVLAGGIAHDFNNLLTGVVGNAELALLNLSGESAAARYVAEIKRTSERLADLTDQMLAYSGKGQFLVRPLSLSDVVDDMRDLLRVSTSKRVTITYDLDEDLPPIDADAVQLRQVTMNLVTNASEAIEEGTGTITVRTGIVDAHRGYLSKTVLGSDLPEARYVLLQVSDTGTGMDESVQERIFEPFFTSKATGRGLGLAAVQGIMRGHGGAVDVRSEPGSGSVFTLLFPVSERPMVRQHEAPGLRQDPGGSGTVLVVDDEQVVREVTERMLTTSGFEVILAEDGHRALEVLTTRPGKVDVVLLDLTLPHMDGMTIFREIRKILPELPVVLASGFSEQEAVGQFEGDGQGLSGFVQKPFRMDTLAATIRRALGNEPTKGITRGS